MTVASSNDKERWDPVGVIENDQPLHDVVTLSLPTSVRARYFKLSFQMPDSYARMLLGEIEIIGPPRDGDSEATPPPRSRPMHIKKVLDDALLQAGVEYLYSCYATDVLRDDAGQPCGIVMANRAGRQAVVAKLILDATPHAAVARLAGATFRGSPGTRRTFKRVVIGGGAREDAGLRARSAATAFQGDLPNAANMPSGAYPVIEYTMTLDVPDGSYAALMRADQQARSLTYDPAQQYTSDVLFEVPEDCIAGRAPAESHEPGKFAPGAFRPANVDRLIVLGGCADVSRAEAEKLMRPVTLIGVGQWLGKQLATESRELPQPRAARVTGTTTDAPVAEGDIRELLQGPRPTGQYLTVPQQARAVPVLGTYDVVVIGGGTGGAPGGIGAARRGAKTLVVEYLHGLGGVGTEGAISSYYWGNRVGFTATVLDGQTRWSIEPKKEWYRTALLEAGADIWFGTIGCGAFVKDGRVVGAVVVTPHGRGLVLAKTVIDATGNSDVAAAAGAACEYTDATEFGMQGTGLPGRRLGESYNNTDFTIVDETDIVDIWHMLVYSKEKYPDAFDHGRLIDTRERRRIVGDTTISVLDQLNERTHPDTVTRAWSNFDTHGYTIDPYFLIEHPEKVGIGVNIPWRAMLPKGLEGIVVTGLSISCHRDAVPLIRMQADIQNGGYAAGVAAAMAAETNTPVRHIDIKMLQQHLVDIGNLPASVLTDQDSYPVSDEALAQAVKSVPDGRGAAAVLAAPDQALPLLRQAHQSATGPARLAYAKSLAILGCDDGLDTLLAEVRAASRWDDGWNYRGMGQFGTALSPLDILIICLGHAGNPAAVPVIVEKANALDARADFSHHRAVGLALELLGAPEAAVPLAELLAKPGMSGHVHADLATARQRGSGGGTNAEATRRESLRELLLARALFRCGDHQDVGRTILHAYTRDLRGHLARHAQAVLRAESQ
ncbi:MAG: FAD-dependent oxidoreductase [Planctomycetes bacterium]|nr:FAD-dependent oxidoreductase [Planctomycetota bacterium]